MLHHYLFSWDCLLFFLFSPFRPKYHQSVFCIHLIYTSPAFPVFLKHVLAIFSLKLSPNYNTSSHQHICDYIQTVCAHLDIVTVFTYMTIEITPNHALPMCFQHSPTQIIIRQVLFGAAATLGSICRQNSNHMFICNFNHCCSCINVSVLKHISCQI